MVVISLHFDPVSLSSVIRKVTERSEEPSPDNSREFDVETVHGGHYESFGRQRMLEIIDDYLAGKGAMGDASAWINNQLQK